MGFFSRLFRKIKPEKVILSQECIELLALKDFLGELLSAEHYISKREYMNRIKQYEAVIHHFSVLKNSEMLGAYCEKNAIAVEEVEETLDKFCNIEMLVDVHNKEYVRDAMVSEKEYLDGILKRGRFEYYAG